MAIRTIELGTVLVKNGTAGDPNRIKELVGDLRHWLDAELAVRRWPHIEGWLQGQITKKLVLVNFGKYQPNNHEAWWAVKMEGFLSEGFPELMAVSPKMAEFWDKGISSIGALDDPSAVWLADDGRPFSTYLSCSPDGRGLHAHSIDNGWDWDAWFLVSHE